MILFIFRRYEAYMGKYHFIIIGSGWRSLYYVRIAKAMPDILRLDAMYCRIQEKADKMAEEFSIHTTTSIEECVGYKPDFAVVAVNKTSICDVSIEWMDRGITVLSETPAALDMDSLKKLYRYHMSDDKTDKKQVVAEQYREYPYNKARINLVNSGVLGDISCLNISSALLNIFTYSPSVFTRVSPHSISSSLRITTAVSFILDTSPDTIICTYFFPIFPTPIRAALNILSDIICNIPFYFFNKYFLNS